MTGTAPLDRTTGSLDTPTIYDLARMAEAVYQHDGSAIYAASIPDIPLRAPETELECLSLVDTGGFGAAIYRAGPVHVITYRGTKNAPHDVQDTAGHIKTPPQFMHAMQFALDAVDKYGLTPETACFCGHSLGGALAKYVAHNLARKGWGAAVAVSFNGPGLTMNMLEKVLVNGLRRLTDGTPAAFGMRAVDRLIREKDLPQKGKTGARILNVNIDGDTVSQIGEAAGITYTLTAPPFVMPTGVEEIPPFDTPYLARANAMRLRLQYLHSIHTLRRLLADDPFGQTSAFDVFLP